jgi:L-malate glycosyltransferase
MKPGHVALLGPANSIHLQRWAIALAARSWRVSVITQHAAEALPLPAGVALHALPVRGGAGYCLNAPALARLLRKIKPDVLNAHYASGYGTTAALVGYTPTLLSVWGSDVYDFPYESTLKGWWLRRNLRRATAIASTSHAMARQVQRLTPERQHIAITPFGVDMARFAPRADAPQPDTLPTRNGLTLGTVKTLAPQYGIDLLLRAFEGLRADADVMAAQPALRLLIVGGGPQRTELEMLARVLGITAHCTFAGAVPHADVPQWLHRLDVYAAPSRFESFGVAIVEAGACGLPVVVSDAGGLPEVVRDGVTGLVVPRDDVAALQAALKRLVLDAALRERMGRAARAHVLREYEWGTCVDRMVAAYDALRVTLPRMPA